jgi:ABC-type uncharacterized transport system involved in gliding motility auxiliary subunit
LYPLARSVDPIAGGANGRVAQPLVETSPRSWAETSLTSLTSDQGVELQPESGDKTGPVSIAAAVSASVGGPTQAPAGDTATPADAATQKPETRVAVFGDSDFATNSTLGIPGNRDLFMNTLGWLSQQENLISIRPKAADDRRITMTAAEQNRVMLLALLIPVAVFGTGIYSWWRRR